MDTPNRAINPHVAAYHIAQARGMRTPGAAERYLSGLHNDTLLDIGAQLGLRLPTMGGNKPALIVARLTTGPDAWRFGRQGES